MPYSVKEIFYTLQGEGAQSGRAAVFCRFTGCNLWTGLEPDRGRAICRFCDTDFVGTDGTDGGYFPSAADLVDVLSRIWREGAGSAPDASHRPRRVRPYIVFTGGEPLLQLDAELARVAGLAGFELAVETNGTRRVPTGIDWICVSPKAGAELVQTSGHELKLVYPQPGAEPERYADLDFDHFFLQPMAGPDLARYQESTLRYCLHNPQWRISLQNHKLLGIR
ncbi:MAG TPA: 7-carboxy-7-deazaguanine synthase [Planctomycetaceae bacterium]|nr:7-carboxy-7-deazaguanine synthase [Planctomycetaceae bacterium]